MGRDMAERWAESTAAPRILFGAGVSKAPEKEEKALCNQMSKAVTGLGPRVGQRQPPTIALREQSSITPWEQRILRDNSTILASVSIQANTLPKEIRRSMQAQKIPSQLLGLKGVPLTEKSCV